MFPVERRALTWSQSSKSKKAEKNAKSASIKMSRDLDDEVSDEQRARMERQGMGIFGGVNKGEEELFGQFTDE